MAKAKQQLEAVFGRDLEPVDIALATNMISVGLDIIIMVRRENDRG